MGLLMVGLMMALSLGCKPKYPECEADEDCADHNEYCVNNYCHQCREDANCNAGDACKICGAGYTCQTRPGCCHSDLDCPTGVCRKVPGTEIGDCYGNCSSQKPCPAGQKCVGNMCVPEEECNAEKPCPTGYACEGGRCVGCAGQAVHFDYNESKIRLDAKPILEANAKCIKERNQPLVVEGHCDERGTDEYNMALGQKRSAAAQKYLAGLGIAKTLMSTMSYGEERPLCGGHDESCWWQNRRAEFSFR